MSGYTTGEIAKLCSVTVRTVQYYDTRGILTPSSLSEGGRRLYSEQDLEKMKMICFLRELGLSINDIGKVFSDEEPEKVIAVLLEEQEKILRSDIEEQQQKLDKTLRFRKELDKLQDFTPESVIDIVGTMNKRKELRRVRRNMILMALPITAVEYTTLLLWVFKGIWLPFVIGMIAVLAALPFMVKYYNDHTAYICPRCRKAFAASAVKVTFAMHTPNTRRLRCPECGQKSWCVETVREEAVNNG